MEQATIAETTERGLDRSNTQSLHYYCWLPGGGYAAWAADRRQLMADDLPSWACGHARPDGGRRQRIQSRGGGDSNSSRLQVSLLVSPALLSLLLLPSLPPGFADRQDGCRKAHSHAGCLVHHPHPLPHLPDEQNAHLH